MGLCANSKGINLPVGGIAKDNKIIYTKSKLGPFAKAILKNSIFHEGNPDFNQIATTDEGLYSMKDDYGTSYYYRGAVENNYVKFAGFWWRIIRINGNGSIRIQYDGTKAHANGENSSNRLITYSTPIIFNKISTDNAYVGYMYGKTGSDNYATTHTNTNNSTIKTILDEWYKTNIYDKNLDQYVADVIYCNDRSIKSGTGVGTTVTYYGAHGRLISNKTPQFKCPQKNDAFTVNDTKKGNGALTYPVGLITADEIAAAGLLKGKANNKNYLYKSSRNRYWSLSPFYVYGSSAYLFIVETDGSLGSISSSTSASYASNGFAPVISLNADIKVTGNGTATDPYIVVGAE